MVKEIQGNSVLRNTLSDFSCESMVHEFSRLNGQESILVLFRPTD